MADSFFDLPVDFGVVFNTLVSFHCHSALICSGVFYKSSIFLVRYWIFNSVLSSVLRRLSSVILRPSSIVHRPSSILRHLSCILIFPRIINVFRHTLSPQHNPHFICCISISGGICLILTLFYCSIYVFL